MCTCASGVNPFLINCDQYGADCASLPALVLDYESLAEAVCRGDIKKPCVGSVPDGTLAQDLLATAFPNWNTSPHGNCDFLTIYEMEVDDCTVKCIWHVRNDGSCDIGTVPATPATGTDWTCQSCTQIGTLRNFAVAIGNHSNITIPVGSPPTTPVHATLTLSNFTTNGNTVVVEFSSGSGTGNITIDVKFDNGAGDVRYASTAGGVGQASTGIIRGPGAGFMYLTALPADTWTVTLLAGNDTAGGYITLTTIYPSVLYVEELDA